MRAKDDVEKIIAMRESGETYTAIAKKYNVSKQYIYSLISDTCDLYAPARKETYVIEKIVYKGIYKLFVDDYKMTVAKFTKIVFGIKQPTHAEMERTRRFLYGSPVKLTIENVKNICDYCGEPFEEVFKERKGADDERN